MRRGEIWLINLAPTLGAEMQKTRPAVIANDDEIGLLPLRVIVAITDWKDRYAQAPWMVRLESSPENGLSKTSAADAFQVRSVSEQRFVRRLGSLPPAVMEAIGNALKSVLKLQD
ncbi:MAG: type II toxin-antitoxin system PemK/MazF family toxin [Verrucomicrobia bacterium]|nr:type II toxin-antitoxin system PemK/MazF family toxin [Verrucomicrobiota bacterium]